MRTQDLWTYPGGTWDGQELINFDVEALDGEVGTVDEATFEVGHSYLVVDTGPWIFGKKVMLPAGVIQRVDIDQSTVWVDRTKDQIEKSPEFDEAKYRDPAYRSDIGTYYGEGSGFRDR